MGIRYEPAPDLQEKTKQIVNLLFPYVKLDSVVCLRSYGSTSRGTIARCHALGKAMQIALGRRGFYLIEVIHERFDKMNEAEQTRTLIHELMHIPKTFGGGFKFHDVVNERSVGQMYERYVNLSKNNFKEISLEKKQEKSEEEMWKELEERENKQKGEERKEQKKVEEKIKQQKKHGRFWF